MAIRFFGANGFSAETEEKYNKWYFEQNEKAIKKQQAEVHPSDPFYDTYQMSWELGFPYAGAIGGEITFEITPTSLGDILVAKHKITGEEINLTEYNTW